MRQGLIVQPRQASNSSCLSLPTAEKEVSFNGSIRKTLLSRKGHGLNDRTLGVAAKSRWEVNCTFWWMDARASLQEQYRVPITCELGSLVALPSLETKFPHLQRARHPRARESCRSGGGRQGARARWLGARLARLPRAAARLVGSSARACAIAEPRGASAAHCRAGLAAATPIGKGGAGRRGTAPTPHGPAGPGPPRGPRRPALQGARGRRVPPRPGPAVRAGTLEPESPRGPQTQAWDPRRPCSVLQSPTPLHPTPQIPAPFLGSPQPGASGRGVSVRVCPPEPCGSPPSPLHLQEWGVGHFAGS